MESNGDEIVDEDSDVDDGDADRDDVTTCAGRLVIV